MFSFNKHTALYRMFDPVSIAKDLIRTVIPNQTNDIIRWYNFLAPNREQFSAMIWFVRQVYSEVKYL
jgi:hypothetical protein